MRSRTIGGAYVFASAVGFGTLAIFGKFAEAAGLGRPTLLFFRFLIGLSVVWAVLYFRNTARLVRGRSLLILLGLGVIYGLLTIFYFWGLSFLSAGLTGVIFYIYPILVVVLSTLFLNEEFSARLLIALILSLSGVVLILGVGEISPNFFGVLLVLIAALGLGMYIVSGRALVTKTNSDLVVGYVLLGAAIVLGIRWLLAGPTAPQTIFQVGNILGIGIIGTAIPLLLLYKGLARIPANHASILGTAEPISTVTLGVLLLNESVTLITFLGSSLILTAVFLIQVESPKALLKHIKYIQDR